MSFFSLFDKNKREKKSLQKQYDKLLEEAMLAQRNGDIKTYSELTSQAEKLGESLDRLSSS